MKLGRLTEWCEDEHGEITPFGQKTLMVDDEEFPLLELRELYIYPQFTESHEDESEPVPQ